MCTIFVLFVICALNLTYFDDLTSKLKMASISSSQQKQMPKDALVIACILKELGVNEYEPRVINQLLEFTYRKYTFTLLIETGPLTSK